MEPNKESGIYKDLVIKVDNRAMVPQETIDSATDAIRVLWENYIGKEFTVELVIADYIVDKDGKVINAAGTYLPHTGQVLLGVKSDSFNSFVGATNQAAAACLIVGHEMGHKLQDLRGEKLDPTQDITSEEYKNDPQEAEAWDIALNVFKKVYPNASGQAEYLGRILKIPEKSKYS